MRSEEMLLRFQNAVMPQCTDAQPPVLCSLPPEKTASTTPCALTEREVAQGGTHPNTDRGPFGDLDCGMVGSSSIMLSSSQAFFFLLVMLCLGSRLPHLSWNAHSYHTIRRQLETNPDSGLSSDGPHGWLAPTSALLGSADSPLPCLHPLTLANSAFRACSYRRQLKRHILWERN